MYSLVWWLPKLLPPMEKSIRKMCVEIYLGYTLYIFHGKFYTWYECIFRYVCGCGCEKNLVFCSLKFQKCRSQRTPCIHKRLAKILKKFLNLYLSIEVDIVEYACEYILNLHKVWSDFREFSTLLKGGES